MRWILVIRMWYKQQCKLIAAIARKYARQRVKLIGLCEFAVKLSRYALGGAPGQHRPLDVEWCWPHNLGIGHSKTLIEPSS